MPFAEMFSGAPSSIWSWLTILAVLSVGMYFARHAAHKAILLLSRMIYRACRMTATSLMQAEHRLQLRNREVLLAAGREDTERLVEREFDRVAAAVKRDLSACPAVTRRLAEEITQIEEDHESSTDVPPSPPGWIDAVEAVAAIPSKGEPMVANILEQIHTSLVKSQEEALGDYRDAVEKRHKVLHALRPHWRDVASQLGTIDKKVQSLLTRAGAIDKEMEKYEGVMKGTDAAVRSLSSSSLKNLFVSAFFLAIATGGAVINFQLIARPMAEMVGGNALIGNFKTAEIAALVIILVEISMGLFMMESMRITRLFPVIGALSDKVRRRMIVVTLTLLTLLATFESGLAYMREVLLQDELATNAVLRGADSVVTAQFTWITTGVQMGLGFIL
ncbi:MAG: hypothetical protein HKM95_13495, partial [Inquilinus sp.]|nr:hypothetical protein [Inquilinus sp.]